MAIHECDKGPILDTIQQALHGLKEDQAGMRKDMKDFTEALRKQLYGNGDAGLCDRVRSLERINCILGKAVFAISIAGSISILSWAVVKLVTL